MGDAALSNLESHDKSIGNWEGGKTICVRPARHDKNKGRRPPFEVSAYRLFSLLPLFFLPPASTSHHLLIARFKAAESKLSRKLRSGLTLEECRLAFESKSFVAWKRAKSRILSLHLLSAQLRTQPIVRVIPSSHDDVTSLLGLRLYERMQLRWKSVALTWCRSWDEHFKLSYKPSAIYLSAIVLTFLW